MTFEEEFPSIKNITMITKKDFMPEIASLPVISLRKSCLDKQKVKDAIEKLSKKVKYDLEGEQYGAEIALEQLLKELEL